MTASLRIGIVAGEQSGDNLGAGLMDAIRQRYPQATFVGVGGPKMLAAGCEPLADQERLAVMGYVEPLKRLPELLGIRRRLREHFLDQPPAVFIGIDSPGFNLGLERRLKEAGIKTVHYVSPQVWAWRQGRVKKIARSVDLILTLFPFEAAFYREHRVPVTFVGHTLADQISMDTDVSAARRALDLPEEGPIMALLPGSRGSEVSLLGPDFLAAAHLCWRLKPGLRFVIPAANEQRYRQLQAMVAGFPDLPITLLQGQSHEAMAAADVVIMASGTTTLEAMLLKRPMVVAYRFPPLSYAILSRLVKIPHVALPNILAARELVPELIQSAVSPEALAREALAYFDNPERTAELQETFATIHGDLRQNANQRAAEAVLSLVEADHG